MRFACLALLLAAVAALPAAEGGERPRLGVQIEENAFDPSQGMPVRAVTPGGTAAAIGLQSGDAIKAVNGTTVRSAGELQDLVAALKVGDALTLLVTRQGQPVTLTGTVLAPVSAAALNEELGKQREALARLEGEVGARTREPTLAELIRELQMLQEQFPRAAAEFKKLYPNGEFAIVIRITSDKNAPNAVDLLKDPKASLPGEGGAVPEPAPVDPPK